MMQLKKMRVLILCLLSAGLMSLSSCNEAVQPPQENNNSNQVPQGDNNADQVPPTDNNSSQSPQEDNNTQEDNYKYSDVELVPPNQNCTTNYNTEIPQKTGAFKLCVTICISITTGLKETAPISCFNNQAVCPQGSEVPGGRCLVEIAPVNQPCFVIMTQFPLNPAKYKICGLAPLSRYRH